MNAVESASEAEDDGNEVVGGLFVKAKKSEQRAQGKKDLNAVESTRLHAMNEEINLDEVKLYSKAETQFLFFFRPENAVIGIVRSTGNLDPDFFSRL